jgi:hypothetical protein
MAFCTEAQIDDDEFDFELTYDAHTVTDNEQDEHALQSDNESLGDEQASTDYSNVYHDSPLMTDFNLDGLNDSPSPTIIIDEEDTMPPDASASFLR